MMCVNRHIFLYKKHFRFKRFYSYLWFPFLPLQRSSAQPSCRVHHYFTPFRKHLFTFLKNLALHKNSRERNESKTWKFNTQRISCLLRWNGRVLAIIWLGYFILRKTGVTWYNTWFSYYCLDPFRVNKIYVRMLFLLLKYNSFFIALV